MVDLKKVRKRWPKKTKTTADQRRWNAAQKRNRRRVYDAERRKRKKK